MDINSLYCNEKLDLAYFTIPDPVWYAPEHTFEEYFQIKYWWNQIHSDSILKYPLIIVGNPIITKSLEFAISLLNHPYYYSVVTQFRNKQKYMKENVELIIIDNCDVYSNMWKYVFTGNYCSKTSTPTIILFSNYQQVLALLARPDLSMYLINYCFIVYVDTRLTLPDTAPDSLTE